MPATESTWRNTTLLHRLFAITGVLMTVGTVWMLYKDHFREWKNYQVKTNNIDLKMNELRQNQYDTTEATLVHQQKAEELASARAQAIDAQLIAAFKSHAVELNEALDKYSDYGYGAVDFDPARVDRYARSLADLAGPAQAKRAEATAAIQAAEAAAATGQTNAQALAKLEQAARQADQQAAAAEGEAASARQRLIEYLQSVVTEARTHEDKALGVRKFKSADIDAAKAEVDIAIRDHLPAEQRAAREAKVKRLMGQPGDAEAGRTTFNALNEVYQSISAARKAIERDVQQMTAETSAAQKAYEDSIAELERLKTQYDEREETYVVWAGPGNWDFFPLPGKKVLTMPILDAFSSPRRPENLWSEGLEQTYGSFGNVRRFDRCTTCHGSMVKTLPGQPTTPSYVKAESFEVIVTPPAADALPQSKRGENGQELPLTLEDLLGVRLADEGILDRDDATVALVLPKSPAASAQMVSKLPPTGMVTGSEIRESVAQLVSQPGSGENLYPLLPGLMVGDVIEGINGEKLFGGGNRGSKRVEAMLTLLAQSGEPIRLTIRRGLPNPFVSHPRLDLFLSDNSPHAMQKFGCTVCHEGQGSATDFRWASHTPNTMLDMDRWTKEHGWFDNPHWIFPMYAKRFAESSCLKCHHEVVELEPSEKYSEAPAPKVTHGYHLIRKYGCYGCHEVNGFDGPDRRIGPDLRSEPNYFAVAQQIEAELVRAEQTAAGNDSLNHWKERLGGLTGQVATHPEDDAARNRLRTTIEEAVAAAGEEKSALDRSLASLANMLRDVETPGDQRRPGPSLRFLNRKVDPVFLYDWISDPRHFRPTTRMPKFFGLWDHLKDGDGNVADPHAPKLEPIEIRGVVQYLQSFADEQRFEFEQRPTGIDAWSDEEKVARGKLQFQTRGCLACHNHKDFPAVEKYRDPSEIVQGPDLSNIGDKFRPDRNPQGPDWLYSWIKNPTRYHARTVMPDLFLDPEQDAAGKWFDPADDVATYLLTSTNDWQPIEDATKIEQPLADDRALQDLMLEYLKEAFYEDAARDYYMSGIPPEMESELKGAEKDLIVPEGGTLSNEQRLKYIGRKTIAKYGCFGCHDIPGFEDAKPIGTGLADWGRKDPARLAFEHITHYIEHGHAVHGDQAAAEHREDATPTTEVTERAPYADAPGKSHEADPTAADEPSPIEQSGVLAHGDEEAEPADFADFYEHALEAGNRIGFIYQKLKEPRSYDYEKTENKRYNERLRMPQFPFTAEEREAVVTFVLGLVADPPQAKYVYAPDERQQALIAGREVLEKYNCGGCHILGLEKWELSYPPESFGPQNEAKAYPFLRPHFAPDELAAAGTPDKRNELHATLHGLPPLDKNDGLPLVFDVDGLTLEADAEYGLGELRYAVDLYQPTTLDGSPYMTGQSPVSFPAGQVDARHPTWGGTLTKYLLPEVTAIERQSNPNASGSEAYGWLPPPLIGEGKKVQTGWLHDFLLEPYAIRPAVFLRMPKFNMSSAEATALANYFAAVDGVEYPYAYSGARDTSRLASLEAAYRQNAQQASAGSGTNVIEAQPADGGAAPAPVQPASAEPSTDMHRLDDAMRIVVNGNYCVKCHLVSDFVPPGSPRAKAPNLADVYRRLRPDFMRDWIANPKTILPYTSMPVNVPYDPDLPNQGGVSQDLYHGTSIEQVNGLVDLLMNFDRYAQGSTRIADMVQPAAPAEATTPAAPTTGGGSE